MANYKLQLPEGVQDFLPGECRAKKELEARLRRLFTLNGFDEVETPSFEYYDVFSHGIGAYLQERMIKFFDLRGRILVLRPDLTVPIARMAAGELPEGAQRLFYIQNAFGVNDYNIGQRSEYTQAGVECIGCAGSGTDAALAALAIKCMLDVGLTEFKLDIGQVGFFKGLIAQAGLEDEVCDQLRNLIDMKNIVELEYLLEKLQMDEKLKQKILCVPTLFGGREAVARARALSDDPACAAALDNLEEVLDTLEGFGYGQYLTIDLGMLHNLNYYSGMVFRGISHEIGFPILSGGRYDGLFGEFGEPRPAVGFAMGVKRAMIALERQGKLQSEAEPCIVVACTRGTARQGNDLAERLRASGSRTVLEVQPDADALARYEQQGCMIYRV